MELRPAHFAGSWYPASAAECEREIKGFLNEPMGSTNGRTWVGGIVPHAGWFFSGAIACNVIQRLQEQSAPDVMAVFGMHLHPGAPRYLMSQGAWQTPFGPLPVAADLAADLTAKFDFVEETPGRHHQDNTIELQLPFIRYFFEGVHILPVGVPPHRDSPEIGRFLAERARSRGLKLKVLGSTDLTHYGANYGFSPEGSGEKALNWVRARNDRRIIDAMLAMEPQQVIEEALQHQNACCSGAAATALATGKRMGAETAELLVYATSYDKNPGDSFVGYAGILF